MPIKLPQVVKEQQDLVVRLYLRALKSISLEGGVDIESAQKISDSLLEFLPPQVNDNPRKALDSFFSKPLAEQLEISNHLSRIADMQARVRNCVNSKFAKDFASEKKVDASSFTFVLDALAEKGVSKQGLEEILKETIISSSLTAHPTNPLSTPYTALSMEFDGILSKEPSEDRDKRLLDQIKKMVKTSPVGEVASDKQGKKTQKDEVREAMVYMKNIYNSLPQSKKIIEEALQLSETYKDVKVGNFYDLGVWLAGDGDGNPESTAESLQDNMDLFREEIIGLYKADLDLLGKTLMDDGKLTDIKAKLNNTLNKKDRNYEGEPKPKKPELGYKNSAEFIEDLKKLELTGKPLEQLENLIYRVENFGFRYGKIDIRHEAGDIGCAVADVLEALGKFGEYTKKQFLEDLADKDKDAVIKASEFISNNLSSLTNSEIARINTSGFSEVGKRIFDRMKVVANNPGCSDKLIIAECKNQANALSALFLLKASGNSVAQENSLNIVTLSESADDLMALPEIIEVLLKDETYRKHIVATGKLIYMIAKSDTQRRDGVGAQYAQEIPPELVTRKFVQLAREYPELQEVELVPYNGGGHAIQRGGGRLDELPNVYTKAAMRGLYWTGEPLTREKEQEAKNLKIAPPILTTQGHQNGILYSAQNASNFLISYYSQAIYAAAKKRGYVPEPEVLSKEGEVNEKAVTARNNRKVLFESARKVYKEEVATKDSPINQLFKEGPWAGGNLGNVSSRPGKRKAGGDLQLIDQRAIGAERMCSHSGTHLISWYTAKEGFKAVIDEKGLLEASQMYESDKSTRDTSRSVAISLAMTNFNVAWNMMIGEERPENIQDLANQYPPVDEITQKEKNKITLAHIEQEAIETAKIIYQVITKEKAREDFKAHDLLKELWPDLYSEIEDREKRLEFAHLVEADITRNLAEEEKQMPNDLDAAQILRAIHSACCESNAPVGSMLTLTKLHKDESKIRDEGNFEVSDALLSKLKICTLPAPAPHSSSIKKLELQMNTSRN
jgi:phosphoenolpyruvate carboxylase